MEALVIYLEPGRRDRLMTRSGNPILVQVRPSADGDALFFLNTGEEPVDREFSLQDLGLPETGYLCRWNGELHMQRVSGSVGLHLERHAGMLAWLTEKPLTVQPERL